MNLHPTEILMFRIKHGSSFFSVWHENTRPSSSQVALKLNVLSLEVADFDEREESSPRASLILGSEGHELNVEHVRVTVLFSVTFFGPAKVSRHGFSANISKKKSQQEGDKIPKYISSVNACALGKM